jgi:hypothetical protein
MKLKPNFIRVQTMDIKINPNSYPWDIKPAGDQNPNAIAIQVKELRKPRGKAVTLRRFPPPPSTSALRLARMSQSQQSRASCSPPAPPRPVQPSLNLRRRPYPSPETRRQSTSARAAHRTRRAHASVETIRFQPAAPRTGRPPHGADAY